MDGHLLIAARFTPDQLYLGTRHAERLRQKVKETLIGPAIHRRGRDAKLEASSMETRDLGPPRPRLDAQGKL